jgi:glycosyltransferase involved in cell wall biosynthesis
LGKKEVPHSGFANHNKDTFVSKAIRFLRGNLLIPDARKSWVNAAYKEACKIIEQEKINNIIISTPPHSSQLIGLKLKKKYPKLKWIADLRDPWTDIYYYKDLLHTSLAKKIDLQYERNVVAQCDDILVVSKSLKELFAEKYPAAKNKIHIIANGFDEDDFTLPSHPPTNEFLISHTGTIADSYNPQVFFIALKKVIAKYENKVKIRALFVGKTTPAFKQMAHTFGVERYIHYKDYVPHQEVTHYLKNTTSLLLVLPETANEKGILSGKLFEYLAAKKPVIAIGPVGGDAEEILLHAQAGKMFARNEEDALVKHMSELIEQWLQNSNLDLNASNINAYSRKNLTAQLCEVVKAYKS